MVSSIYALATLLGIGLQALIQLLNWLVFKTEALPFSLISEEYSYHISMLVNHGYIIIPGRDNSISIHQRFVWGYVVYDYFDFHPIQSLPTRH